jgi:hypothetical protein
MINNKQSDTLYDHLVTLFEDSNNITPMANILNTCNYYDIQDLKDIGNLSRMTMSTMYVNIHILPAKHEQLQHIMSTLEHLKMLELHTYSENVSIFLFTKYAYLWEYKTLLPVKCCI